MLGRSMNCKVLSLFASVCLIACTVANAAPAVGKIVYVSGSAVVVRDGEAPHKLKKGDSVYNEDRLFTLVGRAQIKFVDGGFISLQSHSRMLVENYHYDGQENGKESAIFQLLKGGLRALSGAIGHARPKRYQLRTAVATIGIRGTAYSALLCQGDCSPINGEVLADGLHARTSEGTIVIQNQGGQLQLPAGKAAFVPDMVTIPIFSNFHPSFAALRPAQKPASDKPASKPNESPAGRGAPSIAKARSVTPAGVGGAAPGQPAVPQVSDSTIRPLDTSVLQSLEPQLTGPTSETVRGSALQTLQPQLSTPTLEALDGSALQTLQPQLSVPTIETLDGSALQTLQPQLSVPTIETLDGSALQTLQPQLSVPTIETLDGSTLQSLQPQLSAPTLETLGDGALQPLNPQVTVPTLTSPSLQTLDPQLTSPALQTIGPLKSP